MRGSRNFRQGGPGQSDKKSFDNVFFFFFFIFFYFSPQLILQKSNGQFQRNRSFSGSNIFQGGGGGGPTFSRGGGGSNCLFPIETHLTCDFPGGGGGSGPPVPPLDPHLEKLQKGTFWHRSDWSNCSSLMKIKTGSNIKILTMFCKLSVDKIFRC